MPKPGDVILIKMHPASGQELKKFRPAIVLQYYPIRNFVTFIPLSSKINPITPFEFLIKPTPSNSLEKPSLALCWYIQTVGDSRIQKTIGKLDSRNFRQVSGLSKNYLKL